MGRPVWIFCLKCFRSLPQYQYVQYNEMWEEGTSRYAIHARIDKNKLFLQQEIHLDYKCVTFKLQAQREYWYSSDENNNVTKVYENVLKRNTPALQACGLLQWKGWQIWTVIIENR